MRTQTRPEPREGFFSRALGLVLGILATIAFALIISDYLGLWRAPQAQTGPAAPSAATPYQLPPTAPYAPAPQAQPPAQAAPVPVEHVVEFQPLPPADVSEEQIQPRAEIVTVQRAPEQTTIIRTVPNKPSGAPIVIDGGVKRMGAP